MPSCTECGAHVSQTYERVLSLRDGTVYCPSCNSERMRDTLTGMAGYVSVPP